jgi:hypothetical protein
MTMSKREISVNNAELLNRKKKKRKKLIYWLAIDFSVAFIVFMLLLYRPGQYNPLDSSEGREPNEVSPFLLKLSSEINNKAQSGRPFEIEVTEEALNDMINRADWPMESEGIMLDAPAALINPDAVVLMGTADFQGLEFIITVELQAKINEQGLMNIYVPKIKVGAVNVTPLARITAKKMYADRLPLIDDADLYSWQGRIAASLLNDESFKPVFKVKNRTLRVERIAIEQGRLTALLVPGK